MNNYMITTKQSIKERNIDSTGTIKSAREILYLYDIYSTLLMNDVNSLKICDAKLFITVFPESVDIVS